MKAEIMKIPITINVNGEAHRLDVKPNHTLLDVLRQDLGLIGTKKGADWENAVPVPFFWKAGPFIPV